MKSLLRFSGVVMIALGTVWFLQGIGVLPGSFMTGQTRWAISGGITATVGLVLRIAAMRRR